MNQMGHNKGFTLLEVLVSLAIMLFGLLGIAGLMVRGQAASYEAYQRQQALALASDMAEKIRSNEGNAGLYLTGGAPLGVSTQTVTDCSPSCTAAGIVSYDLATWNELLLGASETSSVGARAGGVIMARGCVDAVITSGTPVVTVSVAWQGSNEIGITSASTCADSGVYPTNRRRVVTVTVATCQQVNSTAMTGGCA